MKRYFFILIGTLSLLLSACAAQMSITQQVRAAIQCPRVSASDLHWLSNIELAYVYPSLTGDVYTVDINTGESKPLISLEDRDRYGFQWSPDNKYLLYYDGTWKVSATSGIVISTIRDVDYDPVWSADGSEIAYIDGTSIFVIKRDGSDSRQIFAGDYDVIPYTVLWSPDGQHIALIAEHRSEGNSLQIDILSTDGTKINEIPISSIPINLEWSPDSRWIAFTSAADYHLYLVDLDTNKILDITGDAFLPVQWLSDSSKLVFETASSETATVSLDGNITVIGNEFIETAISPDNSKIAYLKGQHYYDPAPDIYVANLDGSDARIVFHNPAPTVCFNP